MGKQWVQWLCAPGVILALGVPGCDDRHGNPDGGAGGTAGSGGKASGGKGGKQSGGYGGKASGGAGGSASGGTSGSGGVGETGGCTGGPTTSDCTGGASSTGGSPGATGGFAATGGSSETGGVPTDGGLDSGPPEAGVEGGGLIPLTIVVDGECGFGNPDLIVEFHEGGMIVDDAVCPDFQTCSFLKAPGTMFDVFCESAGRTFVPRSLSMVPHPATIPFGCQIQDFLAPTIVCFGHLTEPTTVTVGWERSPTDF